MTGLAEIVGKMEEDAAELKRALASERRLVEALREAVESGKWLGSRALRALHKAKKG